MEPRPLWPTLQEPEPGRDCYTDRVRVQSYARAHGYSRAWRVNGEITALQRRDGSFLKCLDNFPSHQTVDRFYSLLDECFSRQCFRPTAYHDPVYADIAMPRLPWTINALFAPQFAGGWNAALMRGVFAGHHNVYDIQSAYLSALTDGLPNPATYRYCIDGRSPGLYVLDHDPVAGLPYPFDTFRRVNATPTEIEIYGLDPRRIVCGIRWGARPWHAPKLFDSITGLSFWKYAARTYWGRWAMTDRVEMLGGNTGAVTPLRSIFANLPWAHLILSRVRMRLYHEVLKGDVRHVFTDSIICQRPRRITPFTVGGWKLIRVYDNGVYIKGPGQYGPMYGDFLDKHAGTPLAHRGSLQ